MALGGVRVPEYIYRSRDISGRDYSGTLEADSLEAFYKLLRERGQFCLDVREAGRASMDINLSGNKINLKYLVVFCRQFSTMLSAGIPVVKCLDILYAQTANKRFKAVILAVYEQVQRGESLSRALKAQNGAFPRLMISMVECGESSGTIDTVMSRLADQFEKDYRSRSKVQQAMIYPAFLAAVTVAVVVFLVTFIMPRFYRHPYSVRREAAGADTGAAQFRLGAYGLLVRIYRRHSSGRARVAHDNEDRTRKARLGPFQAARSRNRQNINGDRGFALLAYARVTFQQRHAGDTVYRHRRADNEQ
jgi:hypothetical protein